MRAKTLDIKIVGILHISLLPVELSGFSGEFDINLVIGVFSRNL